MENLQGPSFLVEATVCGTLGKEILTTVKDKNHKTDSLLLKRRVGLVLFCIINGLK